MNIQEIKDALQEAERLSLIAKGYTNLAFFHEDGNLCDTYKIWIKEAMKFYHINFGTSGAFMVEKATGEIYNIKAYGVPDKNKKLKANLGNIADYKTLEDVQRLHAKRWNYLR